MPHAAEFKAIEAIRALPAGETELDLQDARLTVVPIEVLDLGSLTSLFLSDNRLQTVPAGLFGALPHLEYLDLRFNQISALPEAISRCRRLQTLLLQSNRVAALPVGLGKVRSLTALNIYDNPMYFPPSEVVQQGVITVLQWLRERDCSALVETDDTFFTAESAVEMVTKEGRLHSAQRVKNPLVLSSAPVLPPIPNPGTTPTESTTLQASPTARPSTPVEAAEPEPELVAEPEPEPEPAAKPAVEAVPAPAKSRGTQPIGVAGLVDVGVAVLTPPAEPESKPEPAAEPAPAPEPEPEPDQEPAAVEGPDDEEPLEAAALANPFPFPGEEEPLSTAENFVPDERDPAFEPKLRVKSAGYDSKIAARAEASRARADSARSHRDRTPSSRAPSGKVRDSKDPAASRPASTGRTM